MLKKKILYYIPDQECNHPVIKSQVFEQAKYLQENLNYDIYVYITGIPDKNLFNSIEKIYTKKIDYIPKPNLISLLSIIKGIQLIKKIKPDFVYCRSSFSFLLLYIFSLLYIKVSLVYDARGIWDERIIYKGKKDIKYYFLKMHQIFAFKKSDRQICVSNRFADLIKKYRKKKDIFVIQSCTNQIKDKDINNITRKSLGFSETDIIICYSGGIRQYQKIDKIIELIENLPNNFKLLCMTYSVEIMENKFLNAKIDKNRYCIKNAPTYNNLVSYLKISNAGIIFRDDIIVNNVASPIKISEYLFAGLP